MIKFSELKQGDGVVAHDCSEEYIVGSRGKIGKIISISENAVTIDFEFTTCTIGKYIAERILEKK